MPVNVEVIANSAGLKRQVSAMSEMVKHDHWHKVFLNQPEDCDISDLVAQSGFTEADIEVKKAEILGRAHLNDEQLAAPNSVRSLEDALAITEGYPGSGKTLLIGAMAAFLLSLDFHVALAAATHEATDNMIEAAVKFLADTKDPELKLIRPIRVYRGLHEEKNLFKGKGKETEDAEEETPDDEALANDEAVAEAMLFLVLQDVRMD